MEADEQTSPDGPGGLHEIPAAQILGFHQILPSSTRRMAFRIRK
jgi:hypothetical protein